jgi:cytochrome c oxidase subunit 6a
MWCLVSEEHSHEKEFVPWPHLRIRNKPFPWGDGDTTLFQSKANVGPPMEDSGVADEEDSQQKVHWITQWWWDNLTEDFEKREEKRNAHIKEMQRRANI